MGYPVGASTCSSWSSNNNLNHTLLRDQGGKSGIAGALNMSAYDILVLDRHLKIVFRGRVDTSSGKNGVLSALVGLK